MSDDQSGISEKEDADDIVAGTRKLRENTPVKSPSRHLAEND